MRNLIIVTALALLAAPAAAAATTPTEGDRVNAAQVCRAQLEAMGPATFKNTYGTNNNRSNAFGKCVSRQAKVQSDLRGRAHKLCNEERRDQNFALSHGGKTFEQFYGGNRKQAFARCVEAKLSTLTAKESQTTLNAAKTCRSQRTAMGARDFGLMYGTGPKRANAFGRCVSKLERQADAHEANAAKACRAEEADPTFPATHGGKTFAEYYGTNADDSNAFGNCVSTRAKEIAAEQHGATMAAAKTCKAERAANQAAFRSRYGRNANKSDAFGRCVSTHARR